MGTLNPETGTNSAQTGTRNSEINNKELGQPHFLVDDWAGLALVALRQGDLTVARTYVDQLLAAWNDNSIFEVTNDPMPTLYFIWQVCQGLGLAAADEVLAAAAQIIQAYLDDFPDPETQAIYLQQPHHQALWTTVLDGKANCNPCQVHLPM